MTAGNINEPQASAPKPPERQPSPTRPFSITVNNDKFAPRFVSGDVVTIDLDNPGNTMRLYQLMRSASVATFDLERGGENLTLTVNLDEAPSGG